MQIQNGYNSPEETSVLQSQRHNISILVSFYSQPMPYHSNKTLKLMQKFMLADLSRGDVHEHYKIHLIPE